MMQLKDILYKVTIQSVIGITSKNVNKISPSLGPFQHIKQSLPSQCLFWA